MSDEMNMRNQLRGKGHSFVIWDELWGKEMGKAQRYKNRLERLQKFIFLDAPPVIIGHAALLLAEAIIPKEPGRKHLIEWLLEFERNCDAYQSALEDPLKEIEKMTEDLDLEEKD